MSTRTILPAVTLPTDRPIRVGIIGLSASGGWAASAHVPALRALDGYELRAVAASSSERAKHAAQVHGVPLALGTPEELATHDEVDLVVVSVRLPYHDDLVTAAIEAGKPVLCEWPLGRDLAEARKLALAADAKGLFTAVGLQARSSPTIRYVANLVAEGYVGQVLSTTLTGSVSLWAGQLPASSYRYLLDPANGATMLTIPFAHAIDGVLSAVGEATSLRTTLATRRPTVLDSETGEMVPTSAADQVAVTGTLNGGAVLSAHYRGGPYHATALRWEINGDDGVLLVESPHGSLQTALLTLFGSRGPDQSLTRIDVPVEYRRIPGLSVEDGAPAYNVAHAYAQLLDDLRSGQPILPDFHHAVRRHEMLHTMMSDAGEPWVSRGA